jgi:hypothetical protein
MRLFCISKCHNIVFQYFKKDKHMSIRIYERNQKKKCIGDVYMDDRGIKKLIKWIDKIK